MVQQIPPKSFIHRPRRIAIIGAGPAGSATAIALSNSLAAQHCKDVEICIFHRTTAKRWPQGETIPPAACTVLRDLQLPDLLTQGKHLPCPGSVSIWGGSKPQANDFLLDLSGSSYHLDRNDFDSSLLREAQRRGVRVYDNYSLRSLAQNSEATDNNYHLLFATSHGEQSISADFVVDASGQGGALVRRLEVARNQVDEVISLYARVALPEYTQQQTQPQFSIHKPLPGHTLLEATSEGWWYLSRVPGGDCVLSLTTDIQQLNCQNLDDPNQWRRAYRKAAWLNQFLSLNDKELSSLQQAPARSAILSRCVGEGWLAVGDAACSFDSISSAGITKALMQGLWAGQALASYLSNLDPTPLLAYQDKVFAQFNQYLGVRSFLYRQECRFPNAGFWQRRLLTGS